VDREVSAWPPPKSILSEALWLASRRTTRQLRETFAWANRSAVVVGVPMRIPTVPPAALAAVQPKVSASDATAIDASGRTCGRDVTLLSPCLPTWGMSV